MKTTYLSLIALILGFNFCLAQKLYIWCPEDNEIKQRVGFLENQNVDLVIFDTRTIPLNSKVECKDITVNQALIKLIEKAYPSCKFTVQSDSEYYKESEKGKLTFKIGIVSYQAGFGNDVSVGIGSIGGKFSYSLIPKGEWNGMVTYYVQLFDNRTEQGKKYSKEINEITSKSNMWGYKTAKSCLFASYNKANIDLFTFIESSLMN